MATRRQVGPRPNKDRGVGHQRRYDEEDAHDARLGMATLASSSSSGLARPPTMLEQLLEEINFQRTKELRQMLKDGEYIPLLALVRLCVMVCKENALGLDELRFRGRSWAGAGRWFGVCVDG